MIKMTWEKGKKISSTWLQSVDDRIAQAIGASFTTDFTENPDNPVWTTQPGSPTSIVKLGNTYHIYVVGGGTEVDRNINHYSTTDLAGTWIADDDNPVLEPTGVDVDWDEHGCWGCGVLRDVTTGEALTKTAKYWMFYEGFTDDGTERKVGIATNADLDGVWTRDTGNSPCLEKSAAGWDDTSVGGFGLDVFLDDDDVYKMLYDGYHTGGTRQIGLASSVDLINWYKYVENPILEADIWGLWGDQCTDYPSVWKTGDQYIVIYSGYRSGGIEKLGGASGTDLTKLTKSLSNPLYAGQASWCDQGISDFSMFRTDGLDYIFFEGEDGAAHKGGWMTCENIVE